MTGSQEPLRSRGMRDMLPSEAAGFRRVEEAFLRVCRSWGYQEVRTPTIEYLHLFTAAGTLSPQMLHRVYSFLDWDGWSGERVVLRPDATIPAARLYSEHFDARTLARLCYVQNIFRFAQGDEPREDWQCGVELVGDSGLSGDIELILLGLGVLEAVGLADVEVRVSHAGIVRGLLAETGLSEEKQSSLYDRLLDGDMEVIPEIESRLPDLDAPLHIVFDQPQQGTGQLSSARTAIVPAVPSLEGAFAQLESLVRTLELLGHRAVFQAALARSFEYYSGPVFRFVAAGKDVGGGGRYDQLLALVGGSQVAASGFALEPMAIAALTGAQAAAGDNGVLVRPAESSAEGLAAAFRAASGLRERGISCRVSSEETASQREVVARLDNRLIVRIAGGEREVDGVLQAATLLGQLG